MSPPPLIICRLFDEQAFTAGHRTSHRMRELVHMHHRLRDLHRQSIYLLKLLFGIFLVVENVQN